MKSNYYGTFNYILFGESHSEEIGIIIEGLKEGLSFDFNEIEEQLKLRQGGMIFNTPRQEKTDFEITTGYEFGKTTGEALCIVFKNNDIVKKDYDHLLVQPRPGHADYVGSIKYKDNQLGSGGSHFSGRMSTPLVAAGAIMQQVIKKDYPNLDILTHINSFQGIKDYNYYQLRKQTIVDLFDYFDIEHCIQLDPSLQKELATMIRPRLYNKLSSPSDILINEYLENDIIEKACSLKDNRDSAGGELETIIMNLPTGIGDPFFDSLESKLSSFIFSIPSIKGISFGSDSLKNEIGSNVKDEFLYLDKKQAYTLYNFNGGINGGISNGDDIVFKTSIKPIASINQIQYTYNYEADSIKPLEIGGRHDATIINRIIPIIDAVSYIVLAEFLYKR